MKIQNNVAYYGDKLQNQFTAYLKQALYHNRISYYRKQSTHLNTEILIENEERIPVHMIENLGISAPLQCVSTLHPNCIVNEKLSKALRNISEKDFTIIRLHIIHGYGHKRIAAILNMTEEAVRVRYYRAIQKMRNTIEEVKK